MGDRQTDSGRWIRLCDGRKYCTTEAGARRGIGTGRWALAGEFEES